MERKIAVEFLSTLEGYHSQLKMLHWSAKSNFEHTLCDNIDKGVLGFEDRFAEVVMGKLNIRFGLGDLKTLMPESKTLQTLLREMESDVLKIKSSVGDNDSFGGVMNVLDDFLESIHTWSYLSTLN